MPIEWLICIGAGNIFHRIDGKISFTNDDNVLQRHVVSLDHSRLTC